MPLLVLRAQDPEPMTMSDFTNMQEALKILYDYFNGGGTGLKRSKMEKAAQRLKRILEVNFEFPFREKTSSAFSRGVVKAGEIPTLTGTRVERSLQVSLQENRARRLHNR
jgi:hypothetical protein